MIFYSVEGVAAGSETGKGKDERQGVMKYVSGCSESDAAATALAEVAEDNGWHYYRWIKSPIVREMETHR